MIYKTHHIGGLLAAEGVLLYFHQPLLSWETVACLVVGYFIAPVADIDKRGSVAGQQAAPLSSVISLFKIRHRTLTHSVPFMLLLFSLLHLSPTPTVIVWTAILAYASHPALDLLNIDGVELLWPLPIKFKLLPKILAIPVDSLAEGFIRASMNVIFTFIAIMMIYSEFQRWPYIGPILHEIKKYLPDFISKILSMI